MVRTCAFNMGVCLYTLTDVPHFGSHVFVDMAPTTLHLCAGPQKIPTPQRHHEAEPAHDDEPCKGVLLLCTCRSLGKRKGVIHQLAIETRVRGAAEQTVARSGKLPSPYHFQCRNHRKLHAPTIFFYFSVDRTTLSANLSRFFTFQ